jgi:hypothetical protein
MLVARCSIARHWSLVNSLLVARCSLLVARTRRLLLVRLLLVARRLLLVARCVLLEARHPLSRSTLVKFTLCDLGGLGVPHSGHTPD